MSYKHIDDNFISSEQKIRTYQAMLVIKSGSVEVADSKLLLQSGQFKRWSDICYISPQCEILVTK